ncbi:MAG: glycosyltransferase [Bacteroidia bacterium]|nr:glycosyltransferase [Bacteroidia bacterium]MCO5254668.1 galactosyltransferase-related protein [Bacteroidota bacterium]MCZ2129438.1 glycosyltransferase [Bacteroidia bacterium]
MDVSLIIGVYKDIAALDLILQSVAKQTFQGKIEVVIAEDNNAEEMKSMIALWKSNYQFAIEHVSHEDKGFRKCKILNLAVLKSTAPYLIIIDGDCLLHSKFIMSHLKLRQPKTILYGRRVMLSKSLTSKILNSKKLPGFNFFKLWLSGSSRLDAALYLPWIKPIEKKGFWGHNWSVYKEDFLAVRGFDEQFEHAGIGEDTDIEWRMEQIGFKFFRIKNRAIQYHLWHTLNYTDTGKMEAVLETKKSEWTATHNLNLLMGSLKV